MYDDRRRIMMEYVKNHEDSTAAEIAEGTGYTPTQVRNSLRNYSRYNGERFYKMQDHSRKGSPIVYWIGPMKLRGCQQKEMIDGLARYEEGSATGHELQRIAKLTELIDGEEEALKWRWRAAERGDLASVCWLERWLERKIEREKGEKS